MLFHSQRAQSLTSVLKEQKARTEALQMEHGMICPFVFHHDGRAIVDYRKGWANACKAAGVPP